MFRNLIIFTVLFFGSLVPGHAIADEGSVELHKNDYKWFQFNLMRSIDNKIPFQNQQDTYFEMEFGGRSGVLDVYGFLDVFDVFDSSDSDRHGGDNFFLKFAPRVSLDAALGRSLASGPFREFYISTLFNIGDRSLFEQYLGVGTDIEIPWLGKLGANLMARYVRENYDAANERKWDGYILATNWFKPFYFFANKSFLSYQGYLDYKFGAYRLEDGVNRTASSFEWFNGLYWHSDHYAAGYGLKLYKDMALFKDGGFAGETSGLGHYLALIYKF